jgi:hypothetical protein
MHAPEHFTDFISALVTAYEWPEVLATRIAVAIGDRPEIIDDEIIVTLDGDTYRIRPSLYDTYA